MQHNRAGRKLGRTSAHRKALFRNQLTSLFLHERIQTTLSKAKELRPLAEKLVTLGKRGGLHARRLALRDVSQDAARKLFEEIAPRFTTRPGGYTRILKRGQRQGDAAENAILEFVDFDFAQRRGLLVGQTVGFLEVVGGGAAEGVSLVLLDLHHSQETPMSALEGR